MSLTSIVLLSISLISSISWSSHKSLQSDRFSPVIHTCCCVGPLEGVIDRSVATLESEVWVVARDMAASCNIASENKPVRTVGRYFRENKMLRLSSSGVSLTVMSVESDANVFKSLARSPVVWWGIGIDSISFSSWFELKDADSSELQFSQ